MTLIISRFLVDVLYQIEEISSSFQLPEVFILSWIGVEFCQMLFHSCWDDHIVAPSLSWTKWIIVYGVLFFYLFNFFLLLLELSKIKFRFIVGRHCSTHTSNRPPQNKHQLHRQKMGKKETFYLWPLQPSHTNQLLIVQLRTYAKKVTGMLGIRFFVVVVFAFFTSFFFSFEMIMNMVTPQVKAEVGQRTVRRLVWSSEIIKNGWPPNNMYKNIKCR